MNSSASSARASGWSQPGTSKPMRHSSGSAAPQVGQAVMASPRHRHEPAAQRELVVYHIDNEVAYLTDTVEDLEEFVVLQTLGAV